VSRKAKIIRSGTKLHGVTVVFSPDDSPTCKEVFQQRRYKVKCHVCNAVSEISRTTVNQRLRGKNNGPCQHCASRVHAESRKSKRKEVVKKREESPKTAYSPWSGEVELLTARGPLGPRWQQTANHH
jgi:uncharacterized protein YlaI